MEVTLNDSNDKEDDDIGNETLRIVVQNFQKKAGLGGRLVAEYSPDVLLGVPQA